MRLGVLISEFLIFLACVTGIVQISLKSALPFDFYSSNGSTFVLINNPPLLLDDRIISINNKPTNSTEETEFIMDGIYPGNNISVEVLREGKYLTYETTAVHFFTPIHIVVVVITGFAFFFVGVIVYHKGTEKKASSVFHWAALATAVTILNTSGNYNVLPFYGGVFNRVFFHFCYLVVPVLFYHFAAVFPKERAAQNWTLLKILYISAVIITVVLNYYFIKAYLGETNYIASYTITYNVLRVFLFIVIFAAIYSFARSYIASESTIEKRKLKWLLLGFITGPLSYILLWVVPQGLQIKLLPETIILLLMVAVPVTFLIAITRHRLFDIDVLLNKSIVYSIVLTILGLLYFAVIYLFSLVVESIYQRFTSVLAAFAAVVLFNPVKKRVQNFIDKKFFRINYNYREALNRFYSGLQNLVSIDSVIIFVKEEINNLIPVKDVFIALLSDTDKSRFYEKYSSLFSDSNDPIAAVDKVEPGTGYKVDNIIHEDKAALIYPLFSDGEKLLGIMLIGEKKSGKRFSADDTDLLKSFAVRISLSLDRILLQRQYVAEQMEKEKFAELDKMKSFFVSGASHELKTPLTSIKMYSEILGKNSGPGEKEYLEVINGECDRLVRIIDNLLDISRIERGDKKFTFKDEDLVELINRSLKITDYHLKSESCNLLKELPSERLPVNADADAVISAIVNLITNAIKYSTHPKRIIISASTDENNCFVSVTDNGPGIKEDDFKFLMTPYFRTRHSKQRKIEGSGIGLALVKHIIEGHKGTISVKSSEQGTSFTLSFPIHKENSLMEAYEKSIDN